MEIRETLEKLDLKPNEVKVYLALLKLGESKAGQISKEAGINRTNTYDALKRLIDKGLVGYVVITNRKWFKAVNPKRLVEFLQEKEELAKEIMPQLEGLYSLPKYKSDVTLYRGLKGIKSVFQDVLRELKPGQRLDIFGSEGHFSEKMPIYVKQYRKLKEKMRIKTRLIERAGREREKSKRGKYTEVRFVPKNVISPVSTNIYGDKVALILWSDPPETIVIENKGAADSYRAYFELLWKIAKKKT